MREVRVWRQSARGKATGQCECEPPGDQGSCGTESRKKGKKKKGSPSPEAEPNGESLSHRALACPDHTRSFHLELSTIHPLRATTVVTVFFSWEFSFARQCSSADSHLQVLSLSIFMDDGRARILSERKHRVRHSSRTFEQAAHTFRSAPKVLSTGISIRAVP